MSTTSYRRVSEATNDSGRVYFQINGIKQSGGSNNNSSPTTTLKLKLSGDSPLSALFSHIESAVERSRPPSSSYDRVPKAAEYRWHNMTISPEVDGRRTPLELGMRTGENHVVVIEVVYPVSSPRRYEQSPASARRGVLLDSENDVSYNSNLVAERIHPGPAGRASDMEDARNDARHSSARRIRGDAGASSPINNQQGRRHTAGVPAGTKRSQSADRVQRTVSDILKDTRQQQQATTTTKVTTPLRQAQSSPYSPPRTTQAVTTTAASTSKRSNYYEESRSEVTTPVRAQNNRRDSSPVEVRDHLSSMLRQRAQESTKKDAVINAQQAELARLEAELRDMAQSSARPRTPTVSSPARAKNTSLRPASPSSSSNAGGANLSPSSARRRPEDETHFSAILRQNRTVNTQVMDEEAKAEALAMAIKNQQGLFSSSASKRESTFHFSKGSTIGSDTQYRHESQWSASDQDQRRREDEVEEEDGDTRHYSERARVPLSPSSSRRLSVSIENQRTSSPVRQHPSEIHPLRTPTGINHASIHSNSSSAAAAPRDDLIQLIEDQKKTISSQQEMLLRLEREMLKLAAAQQRNEDAAASTRQPSTNNINNNNSYVERQDMGNDSQDATTVNVETFIDESVACSVNVSPTRFEPRGGAPLSTASTDGTALSAVEERQQDIVRQQQEQLRELEAELAQLRASSSSQQINHQQQQSSHARREFLQSVITTQATPPRSSPPRSSPPRQQKQQHQQQVTPVPSPQRAQTQPLMDTRTASSSQQQHQQPSSPKNGGIANHPQQQTTNSTDASATTSSASLLRQDSITASKMRATTLENSFLVRQVQIQDYASKESNSRIAILERQLKTQQEKLEITRRQNEVLVAEVEERKRAPRGSLEGKALPGVIPSPYLYHTPARDAAEASQRIADFKGSSSPHGTSHRHHNSVDESFRSLPDNYSHLGSVSPISVGDYSPDRTGQHTNNYYTGPSGANGTVTPVFTQSLSASKYHGDQLVSSRKSNMAPNQEGAPSTTRTPALNETPRRSSNH